MSASVSSMPSRKDCGSPRDTWWLEQRHSSDEEHNHSTWNSSSLLRAALSLRGLCGSEEEVS
jgi:hypothetical protein